jgi:hypothetical protein
MVMSRIGAGGGEGLQRLRGGLDAIAREARANPRVLIGIAAILLLLWSYGTITLLDAVGAAERRLLDTETEIRRVTQIAGETGWEARAQEANALKTRLLARLWAAETEGQAQADFQEAVARAARESGLGRPQIRVDRDPTQNPALGVRVLSASIGADFAPEPLSDFLLRLAALDRVVQVRSLRTTRQPLARLDMLVATYHGPPTQGACAAPEAARPPATPTTAAPVTAPAR